MGTAEIVPGWYADPKAPDHIRYWDGSGWTEHTAAPLPSSITHPSIANFANASLPNAPPLPPAPPRPHRRLPLPALFVLATALIGFPLAIGIGVLAARASAPTPLETPASAGTPAQAENSVDAVAKADADALYTAINRFFQQTWAATPPVVTVSEGNYVFDPVPYGGKTWTWPPIAVSHGVSLMGQNGDSMDTWCVWVRADGGTVKNWQVTSAGVVAGSCGLG